MSHKISVNATFFHRTSSLYPALPVELDVDGGFPVGAFGTAADGSPNLAVKYSVTLAAAATQTINLWALDDAMGTTHEAVEIHAVVITCVTAGGSGTLTKSASDGFVGFGTTISLPVTASCPLVLPSAAGIAVSTTNKNVVVTNTGAASATFNAYILARK
jgi:hypothetical protein